MNTTEFLTIASAICPERTAIIFEGKRYTFAELNERTSRLANALAALGVKNGDRVAMLQVNCNQYVEAYYAVAKLGAIFVPLNFRAKSDELEYMLANCEANALFVGERYIDMANSIRPKLDVVKNYICIESKPKGYMGYEELLASASA